MVALLGGAIALGARLFAPAPASESRELVYALDGDIFVADWDGRNPERIEDGLPGGKSGCGRAGYWAEGPMWSPDGRHFAYRSPRSQVNCARPEADTYPTVLIADATGRSVAEVHGVGWLVAWSPDSPHFATWLGLYPSTTIGVYGLDGTRVAVLDVPDGYDTPGDYDPRWSPDGGSLLVPLGRGVEPSQIWELPIDGGTPRPVPPDDPRSHWEATWSDDGSLVAYFGSSPECLRCQIIVAAADGSGARELDTQASWSFIRPVVMSPAGDRVAFHTGTSPDQLHVVEVATGYVTSLTVATDVGRPNDWLHAVAFSADGGRVLFATVDHEYDKLSLWGVGVDGSEPQLLVTGTDRGDWRPQPNDP
jgi:Tol biopolymer transport system component